MRRRSAQSAACCAASAEQATECLLSPLCSGPGSAAQRSGPPQQREPLGAYSASMLARHLGGQSLYDTHNLYGSMMAQAVYSSLLAARPGLRPLVMSRSGFPGDSAFAATWNGNACWDCRYEDMAMGPAQVINMGLSGYGLADADISCLGNVTGQMCAQWVAAASLFPLMRVHDQELCRWPESTVAARAALAVRFWLLPYIYTLLYKGTQTGAPALRPLWMAFPEDNNTLAIPGDNATWQYMLGDGLLVSPAVGPNASQAPAYFPQGLWYIFLNFSRVVDARTAPLTASLNLLAFPGFATNADAGNEQAVASAYLPAVHVRGGSILPIQPAYAGNTTAAARPPPSPLRSPCRPWSPTTPPPTAVATWPAPRQRPPPRRRCPLLAPPVALLGSPWSAASVGEPAPATAGATS